jgi:glycosyltransferase involved in cell wall biosynthesis
MRILQLTPRIAWPPTDGGRVVMLQVARWLQRLGAEVEVLSLNPRKQRVDVDAARAAMAPTPLEAVDIDTSRHVKALRTAFRRDVPHIVARFFSPAFDAALRDTLRRSRFDVVQVESPFLLPYVRTIRESCEAVIVLRSLNVEYRIWERLAENERNLVRKLAFRAAARSLRRYEVAQLDACNAIVTITEADAREFRKLGATCPMFVLPGFVESEGKTHERANVRRNSVGFLGSLDYLPNQEGALWLAEQVQPRLAADREICIAGSRAPQWLRDRFNASAVHFRGEVPDAAAFLGEMSVIAAPIFSGGGMRIKILEAMAAGRPVISTTIGAEGIDICDGENIVIADDVDSFVAAIESLLDDPARAAAIGEAGRKFVEARYSGEALTRELLRFYEELLQRA